MNEQQVKKQGLWTRFRNWNKEKAHQLDMWSRKKPKRRDIYLNRKLYLMMIPYLVLFFTFTILPIEAGSPLKFTSFCDSE